MPHPSRRRRVAASILSAVLPAAGVLAAPTAVAAQARTASASIQITATVLPPTPIPRIVVPALAGPAAHPAAAASAPAGLVGLGGGLAGAVVLGPVGPLPLAVLPIPGATAWPSGAEPAGAYRVTRQGPTRAVVAADLQVARGARYEFGVRAPNDGWRVSPAGDPWRLAVAVDAGTATPLASPDAVYLRTLPDGPTVVHLRVEITTDTPAALNAVLGGAAGPRTTLPVVVVLRGPTDL